MPQAFWIQRKREMAAYVLGVDAGNSKTIALVGRDDGSILGIGRSGCGDIYGSFGEGGEAAIQSSVTAAAQALAMASVPRNILAACVFSAAGADWPEDFAYFRSELSARGLGGPWGAPIIYNDAMGALRAGSPDGTGVVVAVGTGVATGARSPDGRIWHSSFWQEAQGSVELARKTLRAVYRAELGIDPPTALTEAVLRHFAQPTVEAVLHAFTARLGTPPDNIVGLTRILFDLANQEDATARRILHEQGTMLGDYALAAARRVGIEGKPFHLVLTGGVLRHPSPLLAEALVARVHTTSPEAQPRKSRFEPAAGALLLALEAIGVTVDEVVLGTITHTMPATSFFDT
jgi:N-acetylglucosamine kinase-like BadF-type ATPase